MAIVYLDGPEKSGKSYLAKIIEKDFRARVRHWGPVEPDDRVYLDPLISDIYTDELVVWDRGWAAEHTYAYLLDRDRRLRNDAFLGEWLYGRAVQTVGIRAIILGPSADALRRLRTKSDLPVEPLDERRWFERYGRRWGYHLVSDAHEPDLAKETARNLVHAAYLAFESSKGIRPPHYVGPPQASIVVVGQDKDKGFKFPGAWAPFSSPNLTMLGRLFDTDAFRVGWTNAEAIAPQHLNSRVILACGKRAQTWVKYHVSNPEAVVNMLHPAYAFRSNSEKAQKARDRITQQIHDLRTYLP